MENLKNILITDRLHPQSLSWLKKQAHFNIEFAENPKIINHRNLEKFHA